MDLTEDMLRETLLQLEGGPDDDVNNVHNFGRDKIEVPGVPDGVFRLDTSIWQYTVQSEFIVRACPRHAQAFWHDDEVVILAPTGELDDDDEGDTSGNPTGQGGK